MVQPEDNGFSRLLQAYFWCRVEEIRQTAARRTRASTRYPAARSSARRAGRRLFATDRATARAKPPYGQTAFIVRQTQKIYEKQKVRRGSANPDWVQTEAATPGASRFCVRDLDFKCDIQIARRCNPNTNPRQRSTNPTSSCTLGSCCAMLSAPADDRPRRATGKVSGLVFVGGNPPQGYWVRCPWAPDSSDLATIPRGPGRRVRLRFPP